MFVEGRVNRMIFHTLGVAKNGIDSPAPRTLSSAPSAEMHPRPRDALHAPGAGCVRLHPSLPFPLTSSVQRLPRLHDYHHFIALPALRSSAYSPRLHCRPTVLPPGPEEAPCHGTPHGPSSDLRSSLHGLPQSLPSPLHGLPPSPPQSSAQAPTIPSQARRLPPSGCIDRQGTPVERRRARRPSVDASIIYHSRKPAAARKRGEKRRW